MFDKPWRESDGDWQGGESPVHAPRFKTIADLLKSHGADGRTLDVGCGVAELRKWLPVEACYLGIEPSGAARAQALLRDPGLNIVGVAAESFELRGEEDRFDNVVFNEMLYYTHDPVGLLEKYARFLAPGGIIVCSIYQKGGYSLRRLAQFCFDRRRPISNIHCERMVRAHMKRKGWSVIDDCDVAITDARALSWHIWAYAPN